MRTLRSSSTLLCGLAALALVAAGCGDSDSTPSADKGGGGGQLDTGGGGLDAGADSGGTTADQGPPDQRVPDTTVDAGNSKWKTLSNPAGTPLKALWGLSDKNIWAVGKGGAVIHYNGTRWEKQNNPENVDLETIFGVDMGQTCTTTCTAAGKAVCLEGKCIVLIAAGPGMTLTYDGTQWAKQYSSTYNMGLQGMWGTNTRLWAVGDQGAIRNFTPSSTSTYWSTSPSYYQNKNTLYGVWGASANDVWAVGDAGTILRFNGTSWAPVNSGTSSDLRAIWGSGASDVYAAGLDGTILRWDGKAWTALNTGAKTYFFAIWGSGSSNIFAVGQSLFAPDEQVMRYDGKSWVKVVPPPGTVANAIWGASPTSVYIVGNFNILHFTGP